MRSTWVFLMVALSGCSRSSSGLAEPPVPAGPLTMDQATTCALTACQKLEAAGVANGCHETTRNASDVLAFGGADFSPVGAPVKDKGSVLCYRSDDQFKHGDAVSLDPASMGTPVDDYPAQRVASPKTRLTVFWTSDEWSACREHKPVAACGKAHPKNLAAYKALYDAAKRVVNQ